MNSWAEISEQCLTANYRSLCGVAGADIPVLAVIKADAYGHGAELCAPVLARAGAPWLGVTDAAEGACVRAALSVAGAAPEQQPEILIMCGSAPEDAATIVRHRLTPTVWEPEQMDALASAAGDGSAAQRIPVHLEIDTGMSRQGVASGHALELALARLRAAPQLRLGGVFTHLASAELAGAPETREQITSFRAALAAVAAAGLRPDWVHAGNTSTVDNQALIEEAGRPLDWLRDLAASVGARAMVRSGLALYGHALPVVRADGHEPLPEASRLAPQLPPVLTWKTRIRSLREIPAGAGVGYNLTAHARRPMRLALLPVGYADGLRRELSSSDAQSGGWVSLHGQRVPIVGRISMNLTTVDVTAIPEAAAGDEVILLGPGITAEDHARLAGTIPYEILCGLRPAVRRLVPASAEPAPQAAFAHAATAPVASP